MKLLTTKDQNLIKLALSRTYGEKIRGELGEFEFLRDTECDGKNNQGRVIQLITDYIIWSHGAPKLTVTEYAFISSHPFQQFLTDFRDIIQIVPEVITHYVESQEWRLNTDGLDDDIKEYIPKYIESGVNIE